MELLKQDQNEPNCLACSAVMVIRHVAEMERPWYMGDLHLENLFTFIGHRGQDELWPARTPPANLKGVHPQEIIDWYMHFGYTLWLLERFPKSAPLGHESNPKMVWDGDDSDARFWKYLRIRSAILITQTHALAWDGNNAYDPNGRIIQIKDLENLVFEAYVLVKL